MDRGLKGANRFYDGDKLHQPWQGLRRKDEVKAMRGHTAFDTSPDYFSDNYTCFADDSSLSREEREAAMLLSAAEGHLEEEDLGKALKVAEEALGLFRKAGSSKGVADTLRIMVRTRIMRGERKKGLILAKEELKEYQMADDRRGEAAMLLAVAEACSDELGSRAREDALRSLAEARRIVKQLRDPKMEASACLILSDIQSKKAEFELDERQGFQAAYDAAKEAQALYKDLGDKKGEAKALHSLAIACGNLSKVQDSLQHAKKALAIFEDLDDKKSQGCTLCVIAQSFLMKDSPSEAMPEAKKALEIFQEMENLPGWEMAAMEVIFQVHVLQDELEEALALAEEGLERFEDAEDKQAQVSAWFMIYRAHLMNDELLLARNAATSAETILFHLGDKKTLANLYLAAIELYVRRQQPEKLLQAALQACRVFDQLDNCGHEQANAQLILMDVHMALGENTEALLAANKARELAVKEGDRKIEAISLLAAANIHSLSEQYGEALESAEEARAIFKEGGSAKGEAKSLHMLAKVHADNKDWLGSLDSARMAKNLMQDIGDRVGVVQLLILSADVELVLQGEDPSRAPKKGSKDKDRALEAARDAVTMAKKIGDNNLVIDSMYITAQVHIVSLRLDDGMKVVNEAVAICQEVGMEKEEGRMLVLAAWAHFLSNNLEKGQEAAGQALELLQKLGDSAGEALAHEVMRHINDRRAGPKQTFVAAAEDFGQAEQAAEAESHVAVQEQYQGPTVEVLARRLHVMVKDMFDVDDLENDTMLMDIGIDSLSMLDFQARIAREFPGVTWSPTMLFDYPTLQELGEFMHEALENAFSKKR
mmetsp:Transcript_83615/g.249463  ORF Transcript_83615/g.249463 Transcript_83615/m.249463 type:complete len:826 (-) Transcript_83615:117-2594(-)